MSTGHTSSRHITIVWLALIMATAISWLLGHDFGLANRSAAGIGILLIAIVKVRYVLLDFMELRHAPPLMRIGVETWALLTAVAMSVMYWNGG